MPNIRPPERLRPVESRQTKLPLPSVEKLQLQLAESEDITKNAFIELDRAKLEKENLGKQCQEILDFAESLRSQVQLLTHQLGETKAELEDTRSHILSIQPYVKDITPEEIGRVSLTPPAGVPQC